MIFKVTLFIQTIVYINMMEAAQEKNLHIFGGNILVSCTLTEMSKEWVLKLPL